MYMGVCAGVDCVTRSLPHETSILPVLLVSTSHRAPDVRGSNDLGPIKTPDTLWMYTHSI